jgi:hypothetical protein
MGTDRQRRRAHSEPLWNLQADVFSGVGGSWGDIKLAGEAWPGLGVEGRHTEFSRGGEGRANLLFS